MIYSGLHVRVRPCLHAAVRRQVASPARPRPLFQRLRAGPLAGAPRPPARPWRLPRPVHWPPSCQPQPPRPRPVRPSPGPLRPSPATCAWRACSGSSPWLGSLNERTCSALDRKAAVQPGAARKRPHACDSHDHTVLPEALVKLHPRSAAIRRQDKRSPAARAFVPGPLISRRCAGPAAAGSRAGPARRAAAYPHGPDRHPTDSPR